MKNPFARVQQLRWKLTLSYTAVTVGALLAVELILLIAGGLLVASVLRTDLLPHLLAAELQETVAPRFRPFLAAEPPDVEGLQRWLDDVSGGTAGVVPDDLPPGVRIDMENDGGDIIVVVVDKNRTVLAVWPRDALEGVTTGRPLSAGALPVSTAPLNAALAGVTDTSLLVAREQSNLLMAAPVTDEADGRVLGAVVHVSRFPGSAVEMVGPIAALLGVSVLAFTVVAGGVGTVFGWLTARSLTRRFERLTAASDAWSQGDFSTFVDDPSADEIGQLARRLNRMAEQLQNLLEARQDVAMLEERNRIARELHDSAKQQAFAAAGQIGAARALLEANPEATAQHLAEAEALTDALRVELTSLIHELRPVALGKRGLASAVREYAEGWARQNQVGVDVRIQGERTLPPETEQALFRILQEALSNTARHSRAQEVEVRLLYDDAGVSLTVIDDGCGFDLQSGRRGLGLRSMQERAAALGGKLDVQSAPGGGTRVTVRCPCK